MKSMTLANYVGLLIFPKVFFVSFVTVRKQDGPTIFAISRLVLNLLLDVDQNVRGNFTFQVFGQLLRRVLKIFLIVLWKGEGIGRRWKLELCRYRVTQNPMPKMIFSHDINSQNIHKAHVLCISTRNAISDTDINTVTIS